MAEKRISELTAKGSNLESTDLIEVSVSAGGGAYNTRYITGAQLTGAVSSVNLYNSNGTLTGNRTVTGGGYSLKFTGQSTVSVVSPSASSIDTAFSVRNNTDTAGLLDIQGNGRADFYGDIYARSEKIFLQDLYSIYFNYNALSITSSLTYTSRGEVGAPTVAHDFTTLNLVTTAGAYLMKVRNFNTLHFAINKDGVINCPTMPTSSAGLSTGDLWSDSGTIKIV